jgi:putative intracellular protease/amidase
MQIAILLFDRLTALDAIGPYEVLSRLPDATVAFVAEEPGPKRTENGHLALVADAALTEVPAPDVVLVPGGRGRRELMNDGPVHEWLRAAHDTSTWTTSVCTGSLILAAAGLLEGRHATTHWLAVEELASLGAQPVPERVVFDEKIVTAAGVSAGIDMGLALAARIGGQQVAEAIQLGIEYDPAPPFRSGSPRTARPETVELIRSLSHLA